MAEWFIYYGLEKAYWKRLNMSFEMMKRKQVQGQTKTLSAFT